MPFRTHADSNWLNVYQSDEWQTFWRSLGPTFYLQFTFLAMVTFFRDNETKRRERRRIAGMRELY